MTVTNLAAEDIAYIKEHLGEWLAEKSLGKPPAVYEIVAARAHGTHRGGTQAPARADQDHPGADGQALRGIDAAYRPLHGVVVRHDLDRRWPRHRGD